MFFKVKAWLRLQVNYKFALCFVAKIIFSHRCFSIFFISVFFIQVNYEIRPRIMRAKTSKLFDIFTLTH